ncbi:MAG TPA: ShlB/FhaC/HecB family hemolysin secretion/activation protein, partial [Chitinophagaceae bacterium]|nr:ShlB/FhaC/HecB family hemolysin secretion/activation protein [Chitinophagaceae bacterium]
AFGNADDIVNTDDLLERIFASSKNRVDQQAFLKVRLFDMLINDWDRHEDQWVWALHERDKENVYTPIGRDRDQAFTKTDGIALYVLCRPWGLRPLKNFTPTVKDVRGMNFSARNLDRQFLNEETKEQWVSTITTIQNGLSDQALEDAVKAIPPEANQFSGKTIVKRLKERRDNLSHFGMKYYSALAKRVTINGSAKDEAFVIDMIGNNQVSITGLRRSAKDTFFHRSFIRKETKEINIYGLNGQDQFIVRGNEKNPFKIRVIGGDGKNEYKSEANKISGKKIRVYDSLPTENISKRTFKTKNWDSLYRYTRNSVKYDWYIPLIIPGYNVDDGFSIGLGILYRKQSWGKKPFGWSQQFVVNYATGTQAIGFEYAGLFKQTFGKLDFDLDAFFKGPRYTFRFYGWGNETQLNNHSRSFFKVKANDFYVSPGISRTWERNYFRFGPQYEAVEVLQDPTKFVNQPAPNIDSNIFSVQHFIGVNGKWNLFTAKDLRYPTKGLHLTAGVSYLNNIDKSTDQLKLRGSVGFYYTFFKRLTFAHRTGGETNFGKYYFYHAATIGMEETLRGFWKSRFTGDNSFYQNTELRLRIANLRGYYLRGKLGIFGFLDDGRVWVDGEQSSTLHVGYGGGIYFVPYNLISLNLFYATSKETNMVTLRAGFFF